MTNAPENPQVRRRRRRVVILLVFIAIIVALVFAFRAVLTPFLVALFVAYLLDPLVERMAPLRLFKKFPLGRAGSIAIIYLLLLGTIYLGVIFSVPALGRQINEARRDLPKVQATFEARLGKVVEKASAWWSQKTDPGPDWPDSWGTDEKAGEGDEENGSPFHGPERSRFHLKGGGVIEGDVVARSESESVLRLGEGFYLLDTETVDREERLTRDPPINPRQYSRVLINQVVGRLGDILKLTVGLVRTVLQTFMQVFLILMVTAFLLIDARAIVTFIESVPPKRYGPIWSELLVYIDRGLAGVIRGQLTICAVNGLLTWIGLAILGVGYAGLLGFIAGVFSLIPIFGTILSTIPIVLIAWGADGFSKGMLALGWVLLIHFIEANFLNPKIMGTASKIHPVVVIFALIAGEHAYGIVGALLAVPAASLVQSCFKFYVLDRRHEAIAEGPDDDAAPVVVN